MNAAPRQFRSFGPLDERWLAARGARIDALARALRPAPEPADDPPQDPLLALISDLHGPDAAAACSDWLARSAGLGTRRRHEAERRFAGLVRRLRDRHAAPGEPPAIATILDAAADELRRLTRRPGRAAARRLASILHHVLAWPHAPTGHSPAAQPVSEDSSPAALPHPHPPLAFSGEEKYAFVLFSIAVQEANLA